MPLPTTDTPWPPVDPRVQTALADWDAWYSSEPARLEQRYEGRTDRAPVARPAQYSGGVRGRLARFFWGQPTPAGEEISKLHIPLAGDIARTSSGLLFSEPPALISDHEGTQTRLDAMTKSLHPTLLEAGEVCAALGGAYLRVVWDDQVSDRPWIDVVAADRAAPTFRYGRLTAVTFWTVLDSPDGSTTDQRVFRHLERHERGRIYHGLYEGGLSSLGAARPLADHPATEPLAAEVDAEGGLDTGAPDHLTASYMPNVRPARAWRHIPGAAHWGQSDFQGIEGLMDALDEAWTSWMRDLHDGRSRIIVADSLLESLGPGKGVAFGDRRVYTGLNMLPRAGDPNPITSIQFAIRVKEHADTCAAITEQAARQAGYSASTFGEHGDGQAVTATEIKARERRSLGTRARKALYADPALSDILAAQLAVERGFRFGADDLKIEPPRVEFQDSVTEGVAELATTAELLRRAEAASTETLVRMQHPDWDDQQVDAEVTAILGESGRAVSDPTETGAEGVPNAGVPGDGGGPRP